jgi:gamma-glutamyltranspeptidase/glutathione hydrolase
MIVAPEPLAAQAGVDAFRRGGNAFDAAVATAFAQSVVDPLMCGLGGTALGLVRDARTGAIVALDGSATIGSVPPPDAFRTGFKVRTETVGRYVVDGEINQIGYQSIMVPGFVRTAQVLFGRYGSGKVAWADLLAPAIHLAESGWEIYPYVAKFWASTEDRPGYPGLARTLTRTAACASIFLNNGRPWKEGERLVQPDLAGTLRRLASAGPDDFYTGEIAKRIIQDMSTNGGLFNADDLKAFAVDTRDPVAGRYKDYEVLSAPPPASGVQLVEMLQIAEHLSVGSLGHNTADYVESLARLMIATFLEQVVLKGDPPHSIAMRYVRRGLSRDHAKEIADAVRRRAPQAGAVSALNPGTTHVSVADSAGNIVALTHSTGSLGASGVVTPGLGFMYNNFLGHFHPLPGFPDSIVPGKRGGGGLPAILSKNGAPRIVIGAPGGSRLITSILQSLLNTLEFGADMADAVTRPRFHAEEPGLLFAEPAIDEGVVEEVKRRGFRVERSTYMSRVQAIRLDQDRGTMEAGPDPRGGGGVGSFEG